jgi:DNA-binding transcriptional regulator YdaS (Cro superfamily)
VTKLKAYLDANGWRPYYLVAVAAGVSPSVFSEYASGRRRMKLLHVGHIARALGCNPEDITGDVDEEEGAVL